MNQPPSTDFYEETYFEIVRDKRNLLSEKQIRDRIKKSMYFEGKPDTNNVKLSRIFIDSLNGYETEGFRMSGKDTLRLFYHVVLFDSVELYEFRGISGNEFKENLNSFRKIIQSFKRK